MEQSKSSGTNRIPKWVLALFPLVILLGLGALFIAVDPLSFFAGSFPPLEELTIQRVTFPIQRVTFPENGRIQLNVINGGPDPVTIAQVLVDDAYWQYEIVLPGSGPDNTLNRLEQATIALNYPWVDGEPLHIVLITSTGATFDTEVEVAVQSPQTSAASFLNYGLLGIYVGVIPVALGMLWFPFMRRLDLTIGLLVFLFIDTILEAVEISAELPGVFQGISLVVFGTLFSLGILLAISQRRGSASIDAPTDVATFIALGIGLHNFGEGLAIGAAFATGAAALGSFLVIGFTLHNITEGVAIVAPLTKVKPRLLTLVLLALLAGTPAILGTWIGGFAFNPFLAVLFLSLGAGAILQVIWEVGKLLVRDARRRQETAVSWLNFSAITAGILIMYATAFLVKF
jgi:zinc transporter ZupT